MELKKKEAKLMGGRGSSLQSSSNPKKSNKPEKTKEKKERYTTAEGETVEITKGSPMSIDQADNHNGNPNWRGGQKGRAEYNTARRTMKLAAHKSNILMPKRWEAAKKGDEKAVKELEKQISEAGKVWNKNYKTLNRIRNETRAYSVNCQRSIIAFELRSRGYQVIADKNDNSLFGNLGYREYVRQILKNKNHQNFQFPRRVADRPGFVDETLKRELKVGQRAVIDWGWRGRNSGHTINVVRTKKGLLYVDEQGGRKAKSMAKYLGKNLINSIDSNSLGYIRTDNLELDVARLIRNHVIKPA